MRRGGSEPGHGGPAQGAACARCPGARRRRRVPRQRRGSPGSGRGRVQVGGKEVGAKMSIASRRASHAYLPSRSPRCSQLSGAINGQRATMADPSAFFAVLAEFGCELDAAHAENEAADAGAGGAAKVRRCERAVCGGSAAARAAACMASPADCTSLAPPCRRRTSLPRSASAPPAWTLAGVATRHPTPPTSRSPSRRSRWGGWTRRRATPRPRAAALGLARLTATSSSCQRRWWRSLQSRSAC